MTERLQVLLIEDDELDADLVRIELERAGFEVQWERVDTEVALREALSRVRWDLIISDFSMPRFNGLDAFEVFRSSAIDTPFIFVSGALGEERAVAAMRAGARDYFLKGNLARLGVAVRRELSEARTRQEQRAATERAALERQRLTIAVEATGAGVYEHGTSAQDRLQVSDRWLGIFGYDRSEFETIASPEQWLGEATHPEDLPFVARAYDDFLSGRTERCAIELRMRHRQGHWLPLALYTKASARSTSGAALHVVGVLLDLSGQRALEQQLRQAQKMEAIGRLAGGVAHDFNNLLTAIFSFGSFVLDATRGQGEVHEDMQEVMRAAKKAEGLTAQLLAFSRAKPVEPKIVALNQLVTEMERMLTRVVGEDIELEVELEPNPWNVRIDIGSFEQLLMNLVANARDAMPQGGKLAISVQNVSHDGHSLTSDEASIPEGEFVCLEVSDEGEGMDSETRRRIFEPFFTTKSIGKGTGLGLATVYGIVQQAGGHIQLDSEIGEGTTFRIYLPRSTAIAQPERTTQPPTELRGSETILVVEDEEQVRALALRTLSKNGYHVIDGHSAELTTHVSDDVLLGVDLLLVDVVMPDISGRELAEDLCSRNPSLRVLYMSGHADAAISERGVVDRTVSFLRKPFESRDLLLKVREALDARQELRAH